MFTLDITKCLNEQCNLKQSCYRYTAKSESYQSYALFQLNADQTCDFYIDQKLYNMEGTAKVVNKV